MGNSKPAPPRQPTMEETIIEMKMTARKFTNESKKAEQQEKANIVKAKAALKKNNEQGAKMYLATAASKHSQAMSMQRMAMKMDNLVTTVKSGNSNQMMMGNFNKIANLLGNSNQPNIENMALNLDIFEKTMDEMTVNGRVMDEMMNKNSNADSLADDMMGKLKMEMALETGTQIDDAAKLRAKELQDKEFLDKLKGI